MTDDTSKVDNLLAEIAELREELKTYDEFAAWVWPKVRLWPITGAVDAESLAWIEWLSMQMGATTQGGMADAVVKDREQFAQRLAAWFMEFPASRGMLRETRERIAEAIRKCGSGEFPEC